MRARHRLICDTLRPAQKLDDATFLKAFLDVLGDHFALWTHGVHHRNLDFDVFKYSAVDGDICGALVDHDILSQRARADYGRAGQFMAFELLRAAAYGGARKGSYPLYRHDLEAFYMMLVWRCCCIGDDGNEQVGETLYRLTSCDYEECYYGRIWYERSAYDEREGLVHPSHQVLWVVAEAWTEDLEGRVRLRERRTRRDDVFEQDAQESWTRFCALLGLDGVRSQLEACGGEGAAVLRVINQFLAGPRKPFV
ncbi:unnamed protein product [Peniophora sp. CBMAI 1063]|nr:unnamed protein product [Peniophora sp. CBMAI 1063]